MGYGLWSTEKNERVESGRCREQTKGRGRLSLECYYRSRVTKKTCYLYIFFLMFDLVEPVRFGSVRFSSIDFRLWKSKPNRIEFFLWFFNWLIRFFFYSVFYFWFFWFNRLFGFFTHPYLKIVSNLPFF